MPDLTPAELAEGLEYADTRASRVANEFRWQRWLERHGPTALRELAALRAQAEWRPIAELPEGRNRILACDTDGDVFTADRSLGGTWFDDGSFFREPIYFQHLPEPPKEQA